MDTTEFLSLMAKITVGISFLGLWFTIQVSKAGQAARIEEARKQQRINELLLEELEEKKRNRSRRTP